MSQSRQFSAQLTVYSSRVYFLSFQIRMLWCQKVYLRQDILHPSLSSHLLSHPFHHKMLIRHDLPLVNKSILILPCHYLLVICVFGNGFQGDVPQEEHTWASVTVARPASYNIWIYSQIPRYWGMTLLQAQQCRCSQVSSDPTVWPQQHRLWLYWPSLCWGL